MDHKERSKAMTTTILDIIGQPGDWERVERYITSELADAQQENAALWRALQKVGATEVCPMCKGEPYDSDTNSICHQCEGQAFVLRRDLWEQP